MSMKAVVKLAAVAGVTVGGVAAANAAIAQSVPPLQPWYEGERAAYFWRGHKVAYTVRGVGKPVVLLHGVHAAASSYEWRHNFEHLAQRYRVYAIDLLGFGLSDRPATRYTAEGYVTLLLDFLRDVFPEPPAIVASSLSAAHATVAAYRAPQNVAGLVLVCPTGLSRLDRAQNPLEAAVQVLFNAPVLGQSLFNMLSSEASIRYYLEKQVFFDKTKVDPEIVSQMYQTSHQPGARYAPAAFVSGALNVDISEIFPRMTHKTLVVWGAGARMAPAADAEEFMKKNPSVRFEFAENAGLLPHDEQPGWFNGVVTDFLG